GGAATSTTQKYFSGESLWKKVQGSTATYYLPSLRVENGQYRKYYGSFAERSPDGSLKYYHNDHLGSSVLVTDASGACVHSSAYMPYGSDRSGVVSCGTFTPPYQFNFKEKEQDGTSFYDYGARIYNPASGRWLSADTSTADGLNRYAYVQNNPLRYRDPTGHDGEEGFHIERPRTTLHQMFLGPLLEAYNEVMEANRAFGVFSHHYVTTETEANEKLDLNRAVRGEIIIANVELTIATVIYAATGARELESTVVGRGRGGRGVRGISKKVRSLLSETNAGKSGLYTGEGVGRRNNCGNCAFSAAHTLAGRPTGAMPSVTGETFGEVAE